MTFDKIKAMNRGDQVFIVSFECAVYPAEFRSFNAATGNASFSMLKDNGHREEFIVDEEGYSAHIFDSENQASRQLRDNLLSKVTELDEDFSEVNDVPFDPDLNAGDSGLPNGERADLALAGLAAYYEKRTEGLQLNPTDTSALEEEVSDLLTDLRHLCHRAGISFTTANQLAGNNFQAEYQQSESESIGI